VSPWKERIREVIVVILGGGRGARLEPLTRQRSKPAVPIAGKYRLIDIPVSNAIHSEMERMFVLTQYQSVSLHRHLARSYKFDIFSKGFIQILAAQQTVSDERWFQGTADAVRRNLQIISQTRGEFVLVLSGDHLYRMDYRRMLREHVESGAEITLAVMPCSQDEIANFGAVRVDGSGRVVEFREKPATADRRSGMEAAPDLLDSRGIGPDRPYLASMGIYLFDKRRLVDALSNDLIDFGHHVIPACVDACRVQSHFFEGYWRDIGTIRSFYEAHMDMVHADPPFDFYDPDWQFYTHPRYLPGSSLSGCRFNQTILAGGAKIEDSTIEESIVGIRASINRATRPPDAPPVGVGAGTLIQDTILDLNARVGRNVRILNEKKVQEAEGPSWLIRDGIVVVPKNSVIPDETVI
jgi:glucose-1-phosphate adenylyltransferase